MTDRRVDYTFIYVLIDPRDDEIRYIGKANDVLVRLKGHIKAAHRRRSRVYKWILELISAGESPVVATLDRVPSEEWQDAEKFYIKEYRRCGFDLLNISDVGNEPTLKKEIQAENGRRNAAAIHSDPLKKRVWHLKREIGLLLKSGNVREETKAKLRLAATKRPDLFGCWASI